MNDFVGLTVKMDGKTYRVVAYDPPHSRRRWAYRLVEYDAAFNRIGNEDKFVRNELEFQERCRVT